tara:strand:+ start:246 stop:452 length:207 start_codon:yes stop_codon:yes gene_type:complete
MYDKEKLVKYNTFQKANYRIQVKHDFFYKQSKEWFENIEKRLNELVTAVILIEKRLKELENNKSVRIT